MARPKLIADPKARKNASWKRMLGLMKKAHELSILCNISVCIIFFSHDENKLVVWPSQEVANYLIDRFYSLPEMVRNMKADDEESYIRTNIKKIEKKIANTRKVIAELEMDHLMFQIHNGRPIDDLSQTEVENLISYVDNKMRGLEIKLGKAKNSHTNVNEPCLGEDQTPTGSGTVYLMDKWILDDDPKGKKHVDGTHSTTNGSRFDLNMEPSDDDEDMVTTTYEIGESSKSGGADDA